MTSPKRGEVWVARLDPAEGDEMQKARPVIVVSSDAVGSLNVKLVVPCTTSSLGAALWRVPIPKRACPGLDRDTCADVLQMRALAVHRLYKKIGDLNEAVLDDVVAAIAISIDYM
jgi:mRNA interferase MazF